MPHLGQHGPTNKPTKPRPASSRTSRGDSEQVPDTHTDAKRHNQSTAVAPCAIWCGTWRASIINAKIPNVFDMTCHWTPPSWLLQLDGNNSGRIHQIHRPGFSVASQYQQASWCEVGWWWGTGRLPPSPGRHPTLSKSKSTVPAPRIGLSLSLQHLGTTHQHRRLGRSAMATTVAMCRLVHPLCCELAYFQTSRARSLLAFLSSWLPRGLVVVWHLPNHGITPWRRL